MLNCDTYEPIFIYQLNLSLSLSSTVQLSRFWCVTKKHNSFIKLPRTMVITSNSCRFVRFSTMHHKAQVMTQRLTLLARWTKCIEIPKRNRQSYYRMKSLVWLSQTHVNLITNITFNLLRTWQFYAVRPRKYRCWMGERCLQIVPYGHISYGLRSFTHTLRILTRSKHTHTHFDWQFMDFYTSTG